MTSDDTDIYARALLPAFPTVAFIDSILARVETFTEYADSVVMSHADSSRRYWYVVDPSRWLLLETRSCFLRADTCAGMVNVLHYRYKVVDGVYAVGSITAHDPDAGGDTMTLWGPSAGGLPGGYLFSNITVNDSLHDSLFVSTSVAAVRPRPWVDAPGRPVMAAMRFGPMPVGREPVYELRGRRLPSRYRRHVPVPAVVPAE